MPLQVRDSANAVQNLSTTTDKNGHLATHHAALKDGPTKAWLRELLANAAVTNAAVDHSVSPGTYAAGPSSGETWRITAVRVTMSDNAAFGATTFGGITALTSGIVLRTNGGAGPKSLFAGEAVKTNSHLAALSTRIDNTGFTATLTWSFHILLPEPVRLVGATADKIELLVSDNLSGLSDFRVMIEGWIE